MRSMRALGGGRYEARGPLTIKGKIFEVVTPFTCGADGTAQIKRSEFGMTNIASAGDNIKKWSVAYN
jgi:polyisoprenoid-binding protein YceI